MAISYFPELQAYVDPIIQRFVESDIEPDDDGNKFREAWHGAHPNDIAEDIDAVRVRATLCFVPFMVHCSVIQCHSMI